MKKNKGIYLFLKRGYWCIQYTASDGIIKQKSTGCKRKGDALKVLSQFDSTRPVEPKPNRIMFSSFTKEFLVYAKGNYSAGTTRIYSLSFQHFLRIIGDCDINKITPKHWDLFKTVRLGEKYVHRGTINDPKKPKVVNGEEKTISPVTVNLSLRSLKAALNTAVRWRLIPSNPFEKLSPATVPKRTPPFLSLDDAEKLLDAIPEKWFKDFVIFALNTGMRRAEILSLRWCDINHTARIAKITNQEDFTTKSGEERVISLNDAALMVLNRRPKSKFNEYIFNKASGRRMEPGVATHKFKQAVRKAGLPESLHLHSTRHSFASLLVGSGTSIFTVSKLLGHSTTKTSEIYAHLLPQHLHREVDKISIGLQPNTQN
jgi:integrase